MNDLWAGLKFTKMDDPRRVVEEAIRLLQQEGEASVVAQDGLIDWDEDDEVAE